MHVGLMHDRIPHTTDLLHQVLIRVTCCGDFCMRNEVASPTERLQLGYGGGTFRLQSLGTQSQGRRNISSSLDRRVANEMESLAVLAKA